MRSLRNRLIAATLAATLLILLVAASLIYGLIRGTLVAEFDETLLAKARAIASVAEQDEGRFELDLESAQMPEFEPGNGLSIFRSGRATVPRLPGPHRSPGHSLDAAGATNVPELPLHRAS